jgi:broad specificity phosphatase PhoE
MAAAHSDCAPFTLILVRHGERQDFARTGSWDKEWCDAHERAWDPRLTPAGQQQATDAAQLIAPLLAGAELTICTSPFLRCAETALCLAAGLGGAAPSAITVDNGLCEFLHADWFTHQHARADFLLPAPGLRAGLDCHAGIELRAAAPAEAFACPVYPETTAALEARTGAVAAAVLARAAAAHTPQVLVLVTHGGVAGSIVRSTLRACEGGVHNDTQIPHMGYCSVSTLQLQGARLTTPPTLGTLPLRLTPTQRWFSTQEPVWRSVVLPALAQQQQRSGGRLAVLELGSWEGASAAWLLAHACEAHPDSSLTCVDHFDMLRTPAGTKRAEKFQHNMRLTGLWHRAQMLVSFTVPALQQLLTQRREWDLVYLDASHEAADTLLDAMLAWKGLKQGGLLVFDDYQWDLQPVGPLHPKPGIDAFLAVHAHELEVLHSGYQVMVRKTVGPRFNF